MESQIWVKSEEKWAYILILRGHEVHKLKVTGNMLTLKGKVGKTLAALEEGNDPRDVDAKSIESLDVRTMSKAEVSPGNGFLTLHGEGEVPKELTFVPAENNADQILQAILAQSGRNFRPTQEEIGVGEALIPPAVVGGLAGVFWFAVYMSAGQIATGEQLEARAGRRRGLQQMLIWVAETLGTGGTIAVGVVLLALVLGWAARRIVHRPERTVWLPEKA